MTKQRIEQAVEIIKYAIENGISVKEASIKCGYADTYVKNVKRDLIQAYDNDIITKEDYDFFMQNYKIYIGSKEELENENEKEVNINLKKRIVGEKMKVEKNGNDMQILWEGDQESFNKKFKTENDEDSINDEESFEDKKYGHVGYPDNHIKTLNQLLKKCDVDTQEWEVADHLVHKWDVTSWKQGFPQTWENFQVKARLKRITTVFEARQAAQLFKEITDSYQSPKVSANIIAKKSKFIEENNLLEIALYDLHIGKLAWAGETGENFDVKIATARFLESLETLLERAKGFTYSRILFPVGNDFFNADNLHNTTTAGTPQDEDLRWQKTFKMGVNLIYTTIDTLKILGVPIDIVIIPGNHDFERSFYLGSVLEARYGGDSMININNDASPRKYYEYGKNLLGFSHGKYEKENALPMLMATEQPEAWGRTVFHEWHLGHFHKKRNINFAVFDKAQVLNEDIGVIVRYLSSLTGTEQWHHKRGFVGSHKAGEAFIWNDQTGMIGHLNANFVGFDREH